MTLDQRVSRAARLVAEGVEPPLVDADEIRARARAVRHRRASLVAAATVTAVVAIGAIVAVDRDDAPGPVDPAPSPTRSVTEEPTPEPTPDAGRLPRSMTPEEVVARPDALVSTVAVDPADPDTRLSIWSVPCGRPCRARGPFAFDALALTTDGYATTTYVRPTFEIGVDLHVTVPREGVFLLVDESNGREHLVEVDGTQRAVTRVDEPIQPDDPRLWFPCSTGWRQNWCSLDLDAAAAHQWPNAWDGSAVRPGTGARPWGTNPRPRPTSQSGHLEAWWDTDEGRQLITLTDTFSGDYVLDTPAGEMAFWARPGGGTIDIWSSRDGGATWQRDGRAAPGVTDDYLIVRRSPGGAFLAVSIYPRLVVWRAGAESGGFEEVYRQPGRAGGETSGAGLWTDGDLVHVSGFATAAVSADDGLTWTTVREWR
jgi:hypothetical protein